MTREIKFKGWNGKKWTREYTLNEMLVEQLEFNGLKEKWVQYTGLKDKNGKEIYEGDIVRYTTNYYGNLKTNNKQEVKWEDDMEHDGFGSPLATGYCLYGYGWEIIGNIYENPKLINKLSV